MYMGYSRLSTNVLALLPKKEEEEEEEEEEERTTLLSNGQGGRRVHPRGRRRRPRLRRPGAGAAGGHRGARKVVPVPRGDRRVRGDAALPLHHSGHRDRVQAPDGHQHRRHRRVRRRRHPRHRVGLRRHDLHPRLLHGGDLRRPHQPGRHLRPLPRAQGLPGARRALRRGAVPRRHLRRRARQGIPERLLQPLRRRRQRGQRRLLHRNGARRRDHWHVCARVHCLLRHRSQAQRPRLTRSGACAAANWVRCVHGAPGDDPGHRHGDQPGEEPRRRRRVQQQQGLERPVDLLGGSVHWSSDRGAVPPDRPPRQRQRVRLLPEQRLGRPQRRRRHPRPPNGRDRALPPPEFMLNGEGVNAVVVDSV